MTKTNGDEPTNYEAELWQMADALRGSMDDAMVAIERDNEAIVDYDTAIRLKPNDADAYYNRGVAKVELSLINRARQDFETARDLAREAGNDSIADAAEQLLRELDATDT